ncbi:MAG: ABC transporter permease DevC [Planctomycetota bacterium]
MTALLTRLLGRLPVGWLQLLHNRTRLVAAVGGVTFANVLIFMQLGFMNALFETSVILHRSFVADAVLVSADFRSLREANPLPRARLYQALRDPAVLRATPVYLGTLYWTDPETGDTTNFRVVGVDPEREVFALPTLQAQLGVLRAGDSALVDRRARDFPPRISRALASDGAFTIEVNGRELTLRGEFVHGAAFDIDGALVVSDQTFLRLFPRRIPGAPTAVLLGLAPGSDPAAVARRIEAAFPERDARAFSKAEWVAAEQSYQARQTPIGFVFGFGVAMGVVVGLVIVYQVLATDVQDHLAEYATFKAIGYRPRYFLGVVFEEALGLACFGFVPGLLLSLVLYRVAAKATALPISMPWTRPVFVLALTASMCAISGAIATRRLNAADPAELF